MIDKQTTLFGLFDDIANQSKRPAQFNTLFQASETNARYIPMNIRDDDILFTINGLKTSQIRGVNIGKMYGEDAIQLLDSKSDEVQFCQFVESIKVEEGKLYGFITVGEAVSSLLSGKIAIFGAGKLSKSIVWNYGERENITIVESEIERTAELLEKFPELDVKLSDENHPFSLNSYDFAIFTEESKVFVDGEAGKSFHLENEFPEEVVDLQNRIDIREWL
jgi:shikimate 5-dehydrogenase